MMHDEISSIFDISSEKLLKTLSPLELSYKPDMKGNYTIDDKVYSKSEALLPNTTYTSLEIEQQKEDVNDNVIQLGFSYPAVDAALSQWISMIIS